MDVKEAELFREGLEIATAQINEDYGLATQLIAGVKDPHVTIATLVRLLQVFVESSALLNRDETSSSDLWRNYLAICWTRWEQ